MFLDRRSLLLLALTAVVLVVLGFVLGRWSVMRQLETRPSDGPVPAAALSGPTGAEAPPLEVPVVDPRSSSGSGDSSGAPAGAVTGSPAVGGFPSAPAAPPPPSRSTPEAPSAPARDPSGPPAPARAGAGAKASGYVVQVYATEEESKARQIEERLRAKGYQAGTSSFSARGRTYYRVRVGPYASREQVLEADRKLREEEGLKTWIIRP